MRRPELEYREGGRARNTGNSRTAGRSWSATMRSWDRLVVVHPKDDFPLSFTLSSTVELHAAMPRCPNCGKHLVRTHRGRLQKLIYSCTFLCPDCNHRAPRLHPRLRVAHDVLLSRYAVCIRCGSGEFIRRSHRLDSVDWVSTNLLSRLQGLVGAPLNNCSACRLQFYDCRAPRSVRPRNADSAPRKLRVSSATEVTT